MTLPTIVRTLLLTVMPATAAAHDLSAQYGPFLGPAAHVLTEADHIAALLGVGLLAGRHTHRTRVALLVAVVIAFLLAMAAPLVFRGLSGFESIEGIVSPASLLVAGVLVALGRKLSASIAMLVAIAVGIVHGVANGLAIEGGGGHRRARGSQRCRTHHRHRNRDRCHSRRPAREDRRSGARKLGRGDGLMLLGLALR